MNITHNKEWTILIYADGNNEMKDVIYNSFNACTSSHPADGINIVMEIGLLSKSNSTEGRWCGVRRYYLNFKDTFEIKHLAIDNNSCNTTSSSLKPLLLEDLGKHNMADPNNLFNFISWGMKTYPAEHFMVILSGHGTDFVGCLTDLSFDRNYIMGIPEMAKAIYLGSKSTKSIIDILVLDMCFMNSVEILYEFSQYDDFIKTMITYSGFAPYEGLDYKKLIEFVNCNCHTSNLYTFLTLLVNTLDFDLTAYKLNKTQLDKIKKTLNDLAFHYLKKFSTVNHTVKTTEQTPLMAYIEKCHREELDNIDGELNSLIIHSSPTFIGLNSSINITAENIFGLIGFYNKLAFSKNNNWTKLLSNSPTIGKEKDIDKVKVRTTNSNSSTIHYILPLNST